MESNPFSQFEDDDDDSEKKSNKKSTKIPRRVPLGLEVDAAEEATEAEEKKPPTLAERIGGLFEKKDEEEHEKEEAQLPEHDETNEEVVIMSEGVVESDEARNSAEEVIVGEESSPDEGDLSEVNEIHLTRPVKPVAEPTHETIVSGPMEHDPEPTVEVEQSVIEEAPSAVEPEETPKLSDESPIVELSREADEELPTPPDAELPPETEPEAEPVPTESVYEDESMSNMAIFNRERERLTRSEVDPKTTESELNEAEYRGEKRGQSRGVVTGLFFGWLLGRHGKKKMGRKYEKQLDVRDKEIKNLSDEQFAAQERLKAIQRNQERLQTDMLRNETGPVLASQETLTKKEEIKGKDVAKELPPEEREITEDTYKTSKGHHVETSTWHRIERDLKTGRIVEDPEVAYGQEFEHETKQEVLREDRRQDDAPAALQLGSLATLSRDDNVSSHYADQARGQTSTGVNFSLAPTDLPASKQVRKYMTNPITWAIALVLVLALIIFGFLN